MEERKLNEKESLELITRMIQNTKDRMAENSGTPFLLWGYVTVIISLLVWFLLKETGNNNWQFLWFLLPVIAFPATLWSQRKARKMLKTYIDRVVDYVWTVFGLGAFLVSCTAIFVWKIPILFVILLMMGVGTQALGTDILDTGSFHDDTHGAAGDHAGTGSGGLHQHAACTGLADDLVGNGAAGQGNGDHVLLGILDALADGLGHLGGLTQAKADLALAVAHHHQGGELHDTTTLNGLGYAVGSDYFLNVLALLSFKSCH